MTDVGPEEGRGRGDTMILLMINDVNEQLYCFLCFYLKHKKYINTAYVTEKLEDATPLS